MKDVDLIISFPGEKLPADRDLERRALPAAGRIDVADVRTLLRRCGGNEARTTTASKRQPKSIMQASMQSYDSELRLPSTQLDELLQAPLYMISFKRPPIGMPSAAVGVTVSGRPCGWGSFPSGSMPSSSYMLPIRSHG